MSHNDYTVLKAELLLTAYVTLNDVDAAASLNAKTVVEVFTSFITSRTILDKLGVTDGEAVLDALATAAATGTALAVANSAINSYGIGSGVDVGSTVSRTMVDSLVASGAFTVAQGAAIKALGERLVSRAIQIGWIDGVSSSDVSHARSI